LGKSKVEHVLGVVAFDLPNRQSGGNC